MKMGMNISDLKLNLPFSRQFSKIPKYFVLLALTLVLLLPCILPLKSMLNFYVDDGFFYLKTANNFAHGLGSTFDKVNLTNGYHPLWFLVLSFFFYISSLFASNISPENLLRISSVLHLLLLIFSYYFIYKSYQLIYNKNVTAKFLLFLLVSITPVAFRNWGLEIHVSTFLLALYIFVRSKQYVTGNKYLGLKALIFSLLILARVDYTLSFMPVLLLFESYDKNLKSFINNFLKLSIPVGLVLISYVSINLYYFEHIMPVSAFIKNSFPLIIASRNYVKLKYFLQPVNISITNLTAFSITTFSTAIYFAPKKRVLNGDAIQKVGFVILCGFGLYFIVNLLFNYEFFQEWYFTCPVFITSLSFCSFVNRNIRITHLLVPLFLFVSVSYLFLGRINSEKFSSFYDYSVLLRNLTTEDDRILQVDYCGITGFFSDRNIINGDGLINSFEYLDYYRNSKLMDYIDKYNVKFYITYSAVIDSASNKVYDDFAPSWGGTHFVFPIKNIRNRTLFKINSLQHAINYEWLLISFK